MKTYFATNFFAVTLAVATFFLIGCPLATRANTTSVTIGAPSSNTPDIFIPNTVNLNVNDTIIWNWAGNNHSTTSDTNGIWDSLVNNTPHSYTNSFPTAGRFPFHCTIHVNFGMRGVVNVAAPHVPPTVTITNPVSGMVFAAPANVTIAANAQDSDGTVTNVQFLVDNASVANVKTAPFTTVAGGLAAGAHTLTAIATDDSNTTGTNSINISVVTPVTVSLSQPQLNLGTNFSFTYSVSTGLDYVVQRATGLSPVTWAPLATNQAVANPATFVDSNTPPGAAYYRVGQLPNP